VVDQQDVSFMQNNAAGGEMGWNSVTTGFHAKTFSVSYSLTDSGYIVGRKPLAVTLYSFAEGL
jgi:hypothetical protein